MYGLTREVSAIRHATLTSLVVSIVIAAILTGWAGEPLPQKAALDANRFEVEGLILSIVNGKAYRFDRASGEWGFYKTLWDPDFFAKNYAVDGARVFRRDESGRRWEVKREFKADFEGAATIRELVGEKTGWTAFTLQSPKAPEIADYVKLRQKILKGGSGFVENVVEPTTEITHGGKTSLRAWSVACPREMVCCKSSLETELLHFRKGDHFWFSAWFLVKDKFPLTLMDLETTWIEGSPGLRIMTGGNGLLVELKWAQKPKFSPKEHHPVPVGKWFRVVMHAKLAEDDDGLVELWQDDVKTVDARGKTLPVAEAIYNRLEVGISATQVEATLFVDDVEVAGKDIR